jgi:MFS transporter, NNP family, nitrate/nitrite transporter
MTLSSEPRAGLRLLLVTIGLGLNLRASILLGPHLHERFGVGHDDYFVLVALPVLVAALVRLPVGVLTDRYGVRVMFPAVSLVAAASSAALGLAGSLPTVVAAGAATGAGSSAFVVGAALVTQVSPYGRRGWDLGVFGLGVAVAGIFSVAQWSFDREGRISALVLAATLVAFAAAAAALTPAAGIERAGNALRECAALVRLAATSSVSLLYVIALSGMLSIAAFLPVYLAVALRFEWTFALAATGLVVTLAAAARLAGGWSADRRPTTWRLVICYGLAAALCLVVAFAPGRSIPLAAITGIAICDGVAAGALLALISKAARPYSAGAVMGVTGAAGALGALIPAALLAALRMLTHSDMAAWILLGVVLLAAAFYVRAHDLDVGLGLAVRFRPGLHPTATTVAVLGEADTRLGAAAVVAGLAELATTDELLVVYGVGKQGGRPGLTPADLAAGLKTRLPRHSVVALRVDDRPDRLGPDALRLTEHVEAGTLTIAVTRAASRQDVAADLSVYLQADRILTVGYDPYEGAGLRPTARKVF